MPDIWTKVGRKSFYDCMEVIIGDFEYAGMRGVEYLYELTEDVDGAVFVTLNVLRHDSYNGELAWGRTLHRQLTKDLTESQIVKLLFGMAQDFDQHEGREAATYRGVRCFGPHIDILAMVETAEHYEPNDDGSSRGRYDNRFLKVPAPPVESRSPIPGKGAQ